MLRVATRFLKWSNFNSALVRAAKGTSSDHFVAFGPHHSDKGGVFCGGWVSFEHAAFAVEA